MIVTIPARNPGPLTGSGNLTYLLPGRVPALVDAGVGDARHVDEIAGALAGVPLARVVVTHNHSDHITGAAALAARWPAAEFLKRPWPARDARSGVRWTPLEGGQTVDAGDGRLEVVWTPGHAPDHVCLFDRERRVLFGGDLLVLRGTVVIPASAGGSLADYLRSLARVRALAPRRVLPAHGEPIEEPADLIDRYLAHRAERERQVLSALAAGAGTPADIVPRVYGALLPALEPFARDSVLAHLAKLEEEGRARRDGERWALVVA